MYSDQHVRDVVVSLFPEVNVDTRKMDDLVESSVSPVLYGL